MRRRGPPVRLVMPQNILAGEEWRPVKGLEDSYEVSNLGRIYSLPRRTADGREVKGKFLVNSRIAHKNSFFCRVTLVQRPQKPRVRVAALVWEAFRGPIPKGYVPYPLDGDQMNCAVDNLDLRRKKPGRWLHANPRESSDGPQPKTQ